MKHFLSVFRVSLRNSIYRELQFGLNFVLQCVGNILWLGFSLFFFYTIYQHTGLINGWDMYQTFFLININQLVIYMYQIFFARNISQLPGLVREGTIDHYLIKPIDLQFLVSTRNVDFKPVFLLPLPLFIMAHIVKTRGYAFSGRDLALCAAAFTIAVLIRYSIGFMIAAFAILFTRISALNAIQNEFFKYAGYPAGIFTQTQQNFFTFLVPVILIANLPASFVLGLLPNRYVLLLYATLYSIILLLLSRIFFYKVLGKYTSVSS